jgi:hypothetical protein
MRKNGWSIYALAIMALLLLGEGRAFGADMNMQSMGGHDASMPNEDPLVFIKDIDKAAQDVVNQVKAGKTIDAQKSVSQLTSGVEKVLPHMTDSALKDKLSGAANEIKSGVNSSQPDIFDLEDQVQALRDIMKQVAEQLQNMK